jgi:YVTN family beta-propeller protein
MLIEVPKSVAQSVLRLACLAVLLLLSAVYPAAAAVFTQPLNSSPIALSADQRLVWVVNPRDDTVSVLRTDNNTVIATIATGDEPRSVALDPNNKFAFVANAVGGTVTVIRILNASFANFTATRDRTLVTGAEPWDIVISPDGLRVFVANSGQDTVTVINALTRTIIGQIDIGNSLCNDPDRSRHFQPRGLAVLLTNTQLYVTRFLSFTKTAGGGRQGIDTGKEGAVCRIAINTASNVIGGYVPAQLIKFAPRPSGFAVDSNGDGVADPTIAYPNQMQNLVIRGNRGFMPNIAASPTSPLIFNNSTQAFVTVMNNIGIGVPADGGSFNLHLGARNPEPGKKRLFFANPWAIAFTTQAGVGNAYVVSAGSDLLVKLNVNAADVVSFTVDADTTRYIDLNDPANPATSGAKAGKNPVGIVILANGTRAYVANHVSGNVSVVDLTTDAVIKTVQTALIPPAGSLDERVNVGAEMFFSTRGHFNRPAGTTVSTDERLSSEGWQGCASCHFNGWTDGVIWQFASGPRKSVNLAGSFNPRKRSEVKIFNYSGIFDGEVEDFEANIRNISGPGGLAAQVPCQIPPPATSNFDPDHGLLIGDNGDENSPPCVINQFTKPNANRAQMTVNPVGATPAIPALTALKQWVQLAVRVPNGPLNSTEIAGGVPLAEINAGRALFGQQCAGCHGGGLWSASVKDFVSPPANAEIACEVNLGAAAPPGSACTTAPIIGDPVNNVQYLDRFLKDVGSFNLGVPGQGNPIGNNVGATEKAAAALVAGVSQAQKDALGIDYNGDGKGVGFNPQSLLGVNMVQPYMHNGACESLACVVDDLEHRTGNGALTDFLNTAAKRAQVVQFLESIDRQSTPFP